MSKSASEVEKILREIRLRVQHENLANTQIARKAARQSSLELGSNVNPEPHDSPAPADASHLQMRLTTLEKTRNNLPPINSRRKGITARAELFVKRQIKRMTKWFTYDQLIFNTAVYESLAELQNIQAANAREFASLRDQYSSLRDDLARLEVMAGTSAEIEDVRNDLSDRLQQLADEQTVVYKNVLMQIRERDSVTDGSHRTLEERLAALENETRPA